MSRIGEAEGTEMIVPSTVIFFIQFRYPKRRRYAL